MRAPPTDSATLRVEISELVRLHWHSVAGLRRESTMLRKELAVSNNIIRTLVKKTNDIASIADQLAVSFIHNRRLLTKIDTQLANVVSNEAATRHARAAAAVQLNVPSAVLPASSANALPSPQTQAEMENQDADWVLVLKPVLETWLQNNFLNASSAADVWVSMTEVNVYLRDYVMARFTVSAKDAVRMLTKSWRLPTRVSKKAAAKAAAETAAGKRPSPKMTAAYPVH